MLRDFSPALNCLHEGGQGRLTLWLRKHFKISTRKKIENSQSYMKHYNLIALPYTYAQDVGNQFQLRTEIEPFS